MRTGIATLPLHSGKAPRWLFGRMRDLSREIATALVENFGPQELLIRLSDPYWFQAFGCVLGFDWHSSGLTTTVCGALKEGLKHRGDSLGVYIAGGKGATSRKTPQEIEQVGGRNSQIPVEVLTRTSRLVAKVDSACVQDGYQLYHHSFFFAKGGNWCVVQQGMNAQNRMARRYHWRGDLQGPLGGSFVNEPHTAVCCDQRHEGVLNLVAQESQPARSVMVEVVAKSARQTISHLDRIVHLALPAHHDIAFGDLARGRLTLTLERARRISPKDFEGLLEVPGVGQKTLRALSLVSEVIYAKPPCFKDPARFAYAHGGKDGHPYPVDRVNYDRSIVVLKKAIQSARLGRTDYLEALRNLVPFERRLEG